MSNFKKQRSFYVLNIIIIVSFFWSNFAWAGSGLEYYKLSPVSHAEAAVPSANALADGRVAVKRLTRDGVTTRDGFYEKLADELKKGKTGELSGVPCLVFSDRRDESELAYYVFNPHEPYFSRITTQEDVEDKFNDLLGIFGFSINTQKIKFHIDGGEYYQQIFAITDKDLEFINTCLKEAHPQWRIDFEKYVITANVKLEKGDTDREAVLRYADVFRRSHHPLTEELTKDLSSLFDFVDPENVSLKDILEGIKSEEGFVQLFETKNIVMTYNKKLHQVTVRIFGDDKDKVEAGLDSLSIDIKLTEGKCIKNISLRHSYYSLSRSRLSLLLVRAGFDKRFPTLYNFIKQQFVLEDTSKELETQENVVSRDIEISEYEEKAARGLIDARLVYEISLLRYSKSQEIRRKALKILGYIKEKCFISQNDFSVLEGLFFRETIKEDLMYIERLLKNNFEYVQKTFRNIFNKEITLQEMYSSHVKLQYLGRGHNKEIYEVEWQIGLQERYRFVVSVIRDAQLAQGDFRKTTLDCSLKSWNRLIRQNVPYVPKLGASVWDEDYRPKNVVTDKVIRCVENNIQITSRELVEGATLEEVLASDIPEEEKRKAKIAALNAFIEIWKLTKDKDGKGLFMTTPKPNDVIVFKDTSGEWRAKVIDLDILEDGISLEKILDVFGLYRWATKDEVEAILETAILQPLEPDLYKLMEGTEIALPGYRFVKNESDITDELIEGFLGNSAVENVYIKVVSSSRKAMHKKAVGGVEKIAVVKNTDGTVNIAETKKSFVEGYRKIVDQVTRRAGIERAEIAGVLVCEEVKHDAENEFFIGYLQDPVFGPFIAIGRGGSGIEEKQKGKVVYIPVGVMTEDELLSQADTWLEQAKIPAGSWPAYKNVMRDVLKIVKVFEEQHPGRAVEEFELNPIISVDGRFTALDARMIAGDRKEKREPIRDLKNLFNTSELKVAICGASVTKGTPGTALTENLMQEESGLKRENIFPINPKAAGKREEIFGRPYYASISAISERIDLVFVAVASKQLENVIGEIIEKAEAQKRQQEAARSAVTPITIVLVSGGMAESGQVGKEFEAGLLRMIRDAQNEGLKINAVGPNCVGIYLSGCNGIFLPKASLPIPDFGREKNKIAIISKSGARMCVLIERLSAQLIKKEIGISPAFSVGNTMDLSEADYLNAILDNCPEVEVIALYLEGFYEGKGQELCMAIKKAREKGKRIVAYLAGKTEKGALATRSHTANMASPYDRAVVALRTAGAEIADTPVDFENNIGKIIFREERFTVSQIKDQRIEVKGRGNVAGIATAGYVSVEWSDTPLADGLRWATFSRGLTDRLNKNLPPIIGRINKDEIPNPIDSTPAITDKQYVDCIEELLKTDETDVVIVSVHPYVHILKSSEWTTQEDRNAGGATTIMKKIIELHAKYPSKPIVVSIVTSPDGDHRDLFEMFSSAGIPVFSYDYQAVSNLVYVNTTEQGSHLVRKVEEGEEEESLAYSMAVDENGKLQGLGDVVSLLQELLDRLGHIYGPGIFTKIKEVRVVKNLKGEKLYPSGRAPLASYRDGILKIDNLLFDYNKFIVFEEVEHEFSESITGIIPGCNEILADVVSTYRSVLRFLEPNMGVTDDKYKWDEGEYREGILSVLRDSGNPIDPDGEYLKLLGRLKKLKEHDKLTTGEIIASVVRYVLRTKLYETVREQLGLPDDLARKIRGLEPGLDDVLQVLNEIKKAKQGEELVGNVEETSELAIKVIKTFTGLRIQGLEGLGNKLAGIIAAVVKVASKRDELAAKLREVKTNQKYCIVLDEERETGETKEELKAIQGYTNTAGEKLFKVVYTLEDAYAKGYTGKNIIHLLDPGDVREEGQMSKDILYLPLPYLRSSLYIAAIVVMAGGDISAIDPLILNLIFDLYPGLRELPPDQQKLLFTEPWSRIILPSIQPIINEINYIRRALVTAEKAA